MIKLKVKGNETYDARLQPPRIEKKAAEKFAQKCIELGMREPDVMRNLIYAFNDGKIEFEKS
jgi:hypothetical protein